MTLRTARLLTATLALATTPYALAQVPPPPGLAPPPGVAPPPGMAQPPAYGATATPVTTGRVKKFIINPNGDIDGLFLADGTQVNFPPHLSTALKQIVRTGDTISVQGFRGAAGGTVRASVITNTATNRSLVDQPPSPDQPPPARPALMALSAEGRVAQLLHADMGELNGAILDDGTIVRWPPPFGLQLQSVLTDNAELKASGYGSQNSYGRAIEATSVAVNGQAPLAIYGPGPAGGPPPAPGVLPPPAQ